MLRQIWLWARFACTWLSDWSGRFFTIQIYLLSPGSIFVSTKASIRTASDTEAKYTEVLYFSFAALTTIGSSGEEALTAMVRQLAVVESAMGQLYLAVLISRLVGFSTSGDAKSI